ncbi:NusG domain II-containing protein [Cytobacillus sp. Hz8]|uniref:NusG domain II-containing protein n=1 Tax=Cytobacillus sp. Hz8 TaxID=3347168 RepID=UPI0035DF747E
MTLQKKSNRRKFIKYSLSVGAAAGSALLLGNKDTLAKVLMGMSEPQWQVTVGGKIVKEGIFSSNKEEFFIPVKNGKAHIVVDNKRIFVHEDSDICERKICAKMGFIREPGESIICKPNKLVVRILS